MSGTITYKRFGEYLLESLDLDPLYVILRQSSMPADQMQRWLLGYWVFYAAGPASLLSEQRNPTRYWDMMFYGNDNRWPRGHERRHMRGEAFIKTIMGLKGHGTPESIVDKMTSKRTFKEHTTNMAQFWGFGQWISFKIYDMMERVLNIPTDTTNVNLFIYCDPVKGAALFETGDQHYNITQEELCCTIDTLLKMFRGYMAPPFMDRPLSPMEIETILCKAKANYNGHYPLGNDVVDIHHGLVSQCWGDTADELKRLLDPLYRVWSSWPDADRNVRVLV